MAEAIWRGAPVGKAVDISQHFTMAALLRYCAPSIVVMIFTSAYVIADSLFISNCVGKVAYASVNIIFPFIQVLGAVGLVFGTGGAALVSITRGRGSGELANRQFSLFIYSAIVVAVFLGALGFALMPQVARLLGADESMLDMCISYGRILIVILPGFVLQYAFESYFPASGKPNLGIVFSVLGGVANIALDALFIIGFGWGLTGAALATDLGVVCAGFGPIVYFARPNASMLRLGRTSFDAKTLKKACINGSSEMVSNIAFAIVAMVYNIQLMRLIGSDGVAAYGVLLELSMIFSGVFMGYAIGSTPLMSYQFGARNTQEMRSIFKKSLLVIAVSGVAMFLLSIAFARPLAWLYVSYDAALLDLTTYALRIYSLSFLIMGFNICCSSLFTSLGNGRVSALLSVLRTFVFEIGSVLVLPLFFGADGIWVSVLVAEVATLCFSVGFVRALGPGYGLVRGRGGKR